MPIDFLSFAYAATVASGGVLGYARAGKVHFKSRIADILQTFSSVLQRKKIMSKVWNCSLIFNCYFIFVMLRTAEVSYVTSNVIKEQL
jgi:hypothetical protein